MGGKTGSVQPGQPGYDSMSQEQSESLPEMGKMDSRKVTKGEALRQTDGVELQSSFSAGEKRRPLDRPVEVVSEPLELDAQAFQKLDQFCLGEQQTLKKAYACYERDLLLEESLQTLEDFSHILESQAYCGQHAGPDPFETLRDYEAPGGLRVEVILEPENRPFTLIPFKEHNCNPKMYEQLVHLCQELLEEHRQEYPVTSGVNELIEKVEKKVREKALSLPEIIDNDQVDGWFEQQKPQSPGFTLRGTEEKVQSFLKGGDGVRSCAVCCHRKRAVPGQKPSLNGKSPQGEELPSDFPQHSVYSSERSDQFSDSGSLTSSEASYESREWNEPWFQKGADIKEALEPEREDIQGMTMTLPSESEEEVFDEETEVKKPFGHSEIAQARADTNSFTMGDYLADESTDLPESEPVELPDKIINHDQTRYKTTKHNGSYYGYGTNDNNIPEWTYETDDLEKNRSGGVVEVKISSTKKPDQKKARLQYEYVSTETNRQAVGALEQDLKQNLEQSKGFKLTPQTFGQLKQQLKQMEPKSFPPINIIRGDVARQKKHVVAKAKEVRARVMVCNASQLNYQEQLNHEHDIKEEIGSVYADNTFGPGMVKTVTGGPELLAHTLVAGNGEQYCGALKDFFEHFRRNKESSGYEGDIRTLPKGDSSQRDSSQRDSSGGYYFSDFTKEDWVRFAKELAESDTRVEGFAWSAAEEKGEADEVKIYQTGGINSGNSNNALYRKMHVKSPPSEFVEFLIIFLQVRNAMLKEASRGEPVAFHSTRIGEGVFGNTENVSALAHLYAYRSLPEPVRGNIQSINIGTYGKEETDQLKRYLDHLNPNLVDLFGHRNH